MNPLRYLLGLSALVGLASTSSAQFAGTKVVETGVIYPGIGGFSSLGFPPAPAVPIRPSVTANPFGAGKIYAFGGILPSGVAGIFTSAGPGAPTAFATTQTAVPGGSGPFTSFYNSSAGLSGASVAFAGSGNPGPTNAGVFANVTGSLQPVINNSTAYPGPGGGTFTSFSSPAVSGNTVVFLGSNVPAFGVPPIGVFSRTGSGAVATVASTATPVPGGAGNFIDFTDGTGSQTTVFLPNIAGTAAPVVVFGGRGSDRVGLFASVGGTLTTVATTQTLIPGGTGNFTVNASTPAFGAMPAIDGNTVAFYGSRPGLQGVYTWTLGTLARVADTTVTAPGGTTPFLSFSPLSVATSGGRVAFVGTPLGGTLGVYTDLGGSLRRVVQVGETIDGKTVSNLDIGQFAFSGDQIAVALTFTNGAQGIYSFTPVPEPGSALAVAALAAAVGTAAARRRRA